VFPLVNVPPEIVTTKGVRDVINFASGERSKNVPTVACCSASGALIPPFVIFKGVRYREIYKQVLPARSEIAMTDSGYINDDTLSPTSSTFSVAPFSRRVSADLGWVDAFKLMQTEWN
jgi:hypothetical protein